jgi:DNA (cytosine-5)-methyltransferase 1
MADAKYFGLDGGTVQGSMGKSTEESGMFQSEGLRSAPSFWSDHVWLAGSDGKSRRSKPSLSLLAHGVSNRVGRLRAYGNAIVPPLAAEVIRAFMECEA